MRESAVGTCQICGRSVKSNRGTIAHHGYTRPGTGWQTESCMGSLYKPYEISRDRIPDAIASVQAYIKQSEKKLRWLKSGDAVLTKHVQKEFNRKTWKYEYEDVEVHPGDSDYQRLLNSEILHTEADIRGSESTLATFQKRYDDWTPTDIRKVMEPTTTAERIQKRKEEGPQEDFKFEIGDWVYRVVGGRAQKGVKLEYWGADKTGIPQRIRYPMGQITRRTFKPRAAESRRHEYDVVFFEDYMGWVNNTDKEWKRDKERVSTYQDLLVMSPEQVPELGTGFEFAKKRNAELALQPKEPVKRASDDAPFKFDIGDKVYRLGNDGNPVTTTETDKYHNANEPPFHITYPLGVIKKRIYKPNIAKENLRIRYIVDWFTDRFEPDTHTGPTMTYTYKRETRSSESMESWLVLAEGDLPPIPKDTLTRKNSLYSETAVITEDRAEQIKIAGRTMTTRAGGGASKPIRWLVSNGCILGHVLYHGRGKDSAGESMLASDTGVSKVSAYDPNISGIDDASALNGAYDTVVSVFVLNVLPPDIRAEVLDDLRTATGDGVCFVAVRGKGERGYQDATREGANWIPEEDGYRYQGARGTFQKWYAGNELVDELKSVFSHVDIVNTDREAPIAMAWNQGDHSCPNK